MTDSQVIAIFVTMIKRFYLATANGVTLETVSAEGARFAPLFASEKSAEFHLQDSRNEGRYQFVTIMPVFVSQEVADRQTIEDSTI